MQRALLLAALAGMLLGVEGANVGGVRTSPSPQEPSALFETHLAPATFRKLHHPPGDEHSITLQIGLKNTRFEDSIDDLLERMSDPAHPRFRPHLSDKELAELSRPGDDSIEAVVGWLKSHGFKKHQMKWTAHQDWISLEKVPLKKVENMLNTTYSVYQHDDGEHVIRTEKYSLPTNLHCHIELIQPTTMFGRLQRQRSSVRVIEKLPTEKHKVLIDPNIPNTCTDPESVTNDCLRQLYKTDDYKVQAANSNQIGITGFLEELGNFKDAQMFLKTQRRDQLGGTFEVVSVNNGTDSQDLDQDQIDRQLGVEANLDTQTALGFTLPTRNIFWSVGGSPPFTPDLTSPYNTNEPYLEWLTYILGKPQGEIPRVISTSYGDNEQTVPISYARRVCRGFAALGARGVSVIFSSGDFGVGKTGFCYANDAEQKNTFLPTFPATCPYVTSVGATENFFPEVAVSEDGPGGFNSGGGFSNYFTTPKWQRKQVDRYLKYLGPETHQGLYNQSGRGFPDVSAQGAKYAIAWQQSFMTVGGTSASAPTFASIIALLNDYSLSLGGPPLGFLNPWLYSTGYQALNDVISGSSSGCNTTGFAAIRGWDPVTGLGTPNFRKLQKLVQPWSTAMAQRTAS
ncbi:hypothetical protein H4Q26_009979 [Puccinia striiformis f. sp. tritici PST-130]|uniref:tripeptidyl-peptidase II n=1 Tax=Puccinia striiformis f. sp. tritici PST-78 TaxID=1165861 RepID=A0A0L0VTR7_9BASI|nr:hypothetical protein Pst134EB_005710 [Puccinia striiformis f. sp. tritici]KAI9613377.1 hypothetical protein H4Q26_009979 [Puccinia striiformis f. sp. tritici PST-130]KNF02666.1 hypothetical protein PSTG_04264 [Puccinia striiformis f. sp. tritici PST-78]